VLDPKVMEPDRRTDDVGDRIDRTDLVKVDFLNRCVVHLRLRFTNEAEDPFGDYLCFGRNLCTTINHRLNMMQVPMGVFRGMFDFHVDSPESCFFDDFRDDTNIVQSHRADSGLNCLRRNAQVDEGPQRHIATNATETIEICDLHAQTRFLKPKLELRNLRLPLESRVRLRRGIHRHLVPPTVHRTSKPANVRF
jgi:hypothetical protein